MRMQGSIIVEANHEKDDKNSLFEHKLGKIQQTPSHISKVMAINNLETLIPWSF
jgi:hypothetical protein